MLTAISDTIRPMAATAPMPGLHGREAETSVLSRALDRAAAGRLAIVLAEGEAGIGKTRLLAETLTHARGALARSGGGIAGALATVAGLGSVRPVRRVVECPVPGPTWSGSRSRPATCRP